MLKIVKMFKTTAVSWNEMNESLILEQSFALEIVDSHAGHGQNTLNETLLSPSNINDVVF